MREIRLHLSDRIKTKTVQQGLGFYIKYAFRNLFQIYDKSKSDEQVAKNMTDDNIVENFHKLYYENGQKTIYNTYWMGKKVVKCPLDLWIYQEIFFNIKPDFIIETGTRDGGSALFFANLCDVIGKGHVISVDIHNEEGIPQHERINYIIGNSVDAKIIQNIQKIIENNKKTTKPSIIVILDSDHTKDHVLAEMNAYNDLVSKGSYLIVEDTNLNGNPIEPHYGEGPMEAVKEFLSTNKNFIVDNDREKLFLTMNPHGYLKKTA